MAEASNQRIAYYNGEYLPEGEIRIPFRDRGFLYGDGVFDMTRTFNGEIFKIREHIERLYRSLKALRIDAGLMPEQMIEISEEVLKRNSHFLDESSDYWVAQRISPVGDQDRACRPRVVAPGWLRARVRHMAHEAYRPDRWVSGRWD